MTCAMKRIARPVMYCVVDDSDSPWSLLGGYVG